MAGLYSLSCLGFIFMKVTLRTHNFHRIFFPLQTLPGLLHLLFQKSRAGSVIPKAHCSTFLKSTQKWCQASCEGKPATCSSRSTRTGFWVRDLLPSTNNLTSLKAMTSARYERARWRRGDDSLTQTRFTCHPKCTKRWR